MLTATEIEEWNMDTGDIDWRELHMDSLLDRALKAENLNAELLAALKFALECLDKDGAVSACAVLRVQGRAAIAKAEGRQQ